MTTDSSLLGLLAALITSLFFTAGSTLFTLGGRQVGSQVLNRLRLLLAVAFVTLAHLLLGVPLPFQAGPERWFWLALSGVLGLALGDAFLFQAFIWIGPRLAMLMMALHPAIAALLAWLFLGEALSAAQLLGMGLTLGGVAWVVLERSGPARQEPLERRNYFLGILFGLGGAIGQALGMVTAKPGLADDFPALSGTLIRMLAAAASVWAFALLRGQAGATLQALRARPKAFKFILGGAFIGPFLGVTFSLLAIQNAEVGVASTLMALPPVLLLPVSYIVFGERFGWRVVIGTLLAISGVALLFIV
ncbi:MAG: DMT family transporter [Anaerolineales bacterium]|nr:DMT family transporter [Anaerolineales bacterium]